MAGVLALVLAAGAPARMTVAQTAAEITPPTLAPDARPLTGAIVFTGSPGLGVPDGADRLSILIRDVTVEDAFPAMAEAHRAAEARLVGRRIPVSELFLAAQDLEAAYAQAGFVLVRVVLPAQELRDGGTLRLVIVDGFVEAVEADAVPEPIRGRIAQVASPLEGQRSLRLREIERALLIAGDTFGLALDSALAQGAVPGATRLVLGGEFRPVTGFAGIDTSYSQGLGSYAIDGGVEFNGLLGLAETIYLRASGNPETGGAADGLFSSTPRLRTLALGVLAPIGTDGLTWNLELTESRTTPDEELVPTTSVFDRASFRLAYPLIRSRELTVTARGSLDVARDRLDAIGPGGDRLGLHRDELRVLRLALGATRAREGGGVDAIDAIAAIGLNAFGARSATEDLPLSRPGARPGFAKLELSGRMVRPLGERLVFTLAGRAQTSFGRPLVKSEQFGIANTSELSGFSTGAESGDSGVVVRGELRAPIQMDRPRALVTPYAFAGSGILWLHQPIGEEQGRRRLSSIGVGVEVLPLLDSRFASATVRLEASRGIRHGGGANDNRFSLVGTVRF